MIRTRRLTLPLLGAAVALVAFAVSLAGGPAFAGEPEPEECVQLSRTWDEAVAEAKLLNVPIVVHSHGFFCGPCWGMHSSLMKNKKYMEFAARNTVEVISLSRLDEGVEQEDRKAETYETVRRGEKVECLVEFPGLTLDEMYALNRSKAASYNDTGKIPFTCLVDPHTLDELVRWSGGTPSKDIMEAVDEARETLEEAHGEGFERKTWNKLLGEEDEAWEKVAKGDYTKALAIIDKFSTKIDEDWPTEAKERLDTTRQAIIDSAAKRIEELVALSAEDPRGAKRELHKLARKLRGTGLEEAAAQAIEGITT